jgi:N-acetylmuramoyl-L-alanine amidase CwlA
MVRKQRLAHRSNYGNQRNLGSIKFLVIHYTLNDGDSDESNGIYFANNVTKTSAHYFVDSDSVTQTVPDNYVAYHCGTTGTYKHVACRNTNSIGIEICDDKKNGLVYPSAQTIGNAVALTKELMEKYSIPPERVIRHFDVTGKKCPAYWVDNAAWKSEFWNQIAMPAAYRKEVQKRFGFDANTMAYLERHPYPDALFEKLATKK